MNQAQQDRSCLKCGFFCENKTKTNLGYCLSIDEEKNGKTLTILQNKDKKKGKPNQSSALDVYMINFVKVYGKNILKNYILEN